MGLKEQLAVSLPADVVPYLSNRFEVVGTIAILDIHPRLIPYREILARAIVSRRKNITAVLNKTSKVTGSTRTAQYEIILGKTTRTVHHESGFSYPVDVGRSFFSTRMAGERKRVADLVRPGERVCVPFAGAGPFAIPAAARGAEVYAIEKNPDAFTCLSENVVLNHVTENCHIMQGDVFDTGILPRGRFDRLIIPTPYGMDQALDVLLPLLAKGGMAHFYTFKPEEQIPGLIAEYERKGLVVIRAASCGNVAPGVSRRVFDLVRP